MSLNDRHSRRDFIRECAAVGAMLAVGLPGGSAEAAPSAVGETVKAQSWESVVQKHPAGDALQRIFSSSQSAHEKVKATGLTRDDYLTTIAGIVDFFKQHQDADGAIIDPYAHKEIQYSTPAFAAGAALLVKESGRKDLAEPAARALTFALRALRDHTAAQGHADFYIPMVIHARRWMAGQAAAREAEWADILAQLVPEKTYRDVGGGGNWNLVNVSGECLRRKDGLVAPALSAAQTAYIERCLGRQLHAMTPFGMYQDPNAPMAYDVFPRLWLEDMLADGAYRGEHFEAWRDELTLGGLSTLLLLSPSGEWPCGGRSAHHQWNEAAVAVVCETNAVRWKALGRPDVASAFKRAARMALMSVRRWRRPTGELWIVKNRADPKERLGYENYSFFSQYNLLPAAMLAIAYSHADEAIDEAYIPSEWASYVFDVRKTFHKVCACAGGAYALIDTGADPHYNATGLMRVHHAGVGVSGFSDNTAGERIYWPHDAPVEAIAPGLAWQVNDEWTSLANFTDPGHADKVLPRVVKSASLSAVEEKPDRASFTLTYELSGDGARPIQEDYSISRDGVNVTATVVDGVVTTPMRVVLPVLVSDGAADTGATVDHGSVAIPIDAGSTQWQINTPEDVALSLIEPRVPSHNGWVSAAIADLPPGTQAVQWGVRIS